MSPALQDFSHWLQNTPMALVIGHNTLLLVVVQMVHFVGLAIWVGTNAAVDLNLMGIGSEYMTAAKMSEQLFKLNWIGFAVAIIGGFMLFSVAAGAYVANKAFEAKVVALIPLGLLTHIVVQRKALNWGQTKQAPAVAKIAGAFELLIWILVIVAAMAIPYA